MLDGLMGAEIVRQRRIGAGSSELVNSVILLIVGRVMDDIVLFCIVGEVGY